jgi:hypothetical protein
MTGKTLIFSGTYSGSESCEKTHPEIFVEEEQRMRNLYYYLKLSGHLKKMGGARLPPSSRKKLWCTVQLRGQTHTPYFYTTPMCTLWL